jgi:FixJ family two-component response regulator
MLDLLMPQMHGFEVLPRLLAIDPTLVVVILTAVAGVPSVVKAMKLGAWNYLAKPWDNDVLVDVVQRAAWERKAIPGGLLVSEDPATLAPLQLISARASRSRRRK